MTEFLTVNTLFYLCITLFVLLATVWLYARYVNKRLTQSIKLINDLYKLSQNQASTISNMLGETASPPQTDKANTDTLSEKMSYTDLLVGKSVLEVKSLIAADIENIEVRAMKEFTDCTAKIERRILSLENQTQQLLQESPELKMYSRANQLVKEGASIDDVMEACQLPRAEVEVIVGLYSHKKKPN